MAKGKEGELHTNVIFSLKHNRHSSFNVLFSIENILSISAPLDMLYPETVIFKLVLDNNDNLVATCKLNSLHINESQWLIMNLNPELANDSYTSQENVTTLRVKICLSGPFRREIAAIISISEKWFLAFDHLASIANSTVGSITSNLPRQIPSAKVLLLPSIPFATFAVALLPILLGLLTVGLPFFLPILVVFLSAGASIAAGSLLFYLSTAAGRESASSVLAPIWSTFLTTSVGQTLVYDTGKCQIDLLL